jgi:CHAT domain-containing protein/Tfp pilus assembly protein PilF
MARNGCCLCAVLAVVNLSGTAGPAQTPKNVTSLEPGTVLERDLNRREEHRYQLLLAAGEWASVIIEQQGIDVAVQVRGADDSVMVEVDDEVRSRGLEQVDVVAGHSGPYTVTVKPARGIIVPGRYAIRVVSRRPATDADRAMEEARRLRTAAARLYETDKAEESQPLLERALTLAEGVRGRDDAQVAAVVAELAAVYLDLPDFARAESLYQRALAITEKTLGPEHPRTALVRLRLAGVYQLSGQRPKAEALLRPSLEIIEKTLGTDHLWFVSGLRVLAALRSEAGDLDQVQEILARELAILEKIEYTESIVYAGVLNNLGDVYGRKSDYVRAVDLLGRALAIGEKLRGSDDYFLSNPLINLGVVARQQKNYPSAEAYYRRALSIRQRIVGPDHPELVLPLNNLANLYHATGDYDRSLQMHRQVLRIGEQAFGPYHQSTLLSVGNIARVSAAKGDMPNAVAFQRRADAIIERQLALNLAVGSERQKLVFVRGIVDRTDRTISLHLRDAPDDPDAGALAALVVLQRKGRVLDAMIDTFADVRRRIAKTSDQSLLDQLQGSTAELARLALNAPKPAEAEARRTAIKSLEEERERLEARLAEHSAEFRAQMRPVTLEAVQRALPADAALLEFAVFRPFDPKAERNAEAYGPPHYAAYVMRRHAGPSGVDLGEADPIDKLIGGFRQALRDTTRNDLKERARAVDARVMRPLRALSGNAARLLISPDGQLNLVPFEALVDEQGRYLIERYAMSYLTSGRDLLRMEVARGGRGTAVIFADPAFGASSTTSNDRPIQGQMSVQSPRRSVTTADDLSAVYFGPLAATAQEARAIKALFPEALLFTGPRATKAALQQVEAPRVLHIATHGFFLRDASVNAENPLLRAGLALTGANVKPDSGILTALEASGLNLWGTKLVTLSACDTGVGEIRNREGVYGLRRAFVLAGSETVVMSLWPVSDYITREMMVAYYSGLRAGRGRGDALRRAKLAMLKRPVRQHPFYWASFIQSGAWTSIGDAR